MRQYLRKADYENAYRVACMGVTEMDWRQLALEAMKGQNWKVARAGFTRLRDVCFLELLSRYKDAQPSCHLPALTLAYQGKFDEAAQVYCEAGEVERAMEMYADLRMFDKAKALAECIQNKENNKANVQEIIQRQAQWTEETNDHETAADMYLIAGQPEKALAILAEHGPALKLIEVARRLKKSDIEELRQCASLMHHHGLFAHAFETYTKLSDFRSILLLHIELEQWEDAFTVKKLHPEVEEDVNIPYAHWLIGRDRFDDARSTYKQAGRPDLSVQLLEQLIQNAVTEKRFKDASYNSWLLSSEILNLHSDSECKRERSNKLKSDAAVYYGYSFIDQSINEPFRTSLPETLFNVARFLLARISKKPPAGVSVVNILVTLARHGEQLGWPSIAKDAFEHLQRFRIPSSWADKLDHATLTSRARASAALEKSAMPLSVCFFCSSPVPLVSYFEDDRCKKCLQPKFWSFLTFDHLPLVEFVLEDHISEDKALQFLHADSDANDHSARTGGFLDQFGLSSSSGLVKVGQATLSKMQNSQVIIQREAGQTTRYFYVLDSALSLFQCPSCENVFEQEEWDFMFLKRGRCAFCRDTTTGQACYKDILKQ